MKLKNLFLIFGLLIVGSLTAYALSGGTSLLVTNDGEEEPAGACTPGTTYCYTNTQGGHSHTCQNSGAWGPVVHCSTYNQKCSTQGPGGRCVF